MANSNEIVQINEINKGLTDLNDTLSRTANGYLKLVKTIEDGNKSIKDSATSFEVLVKAQKETSENSQKLDALGKQLAASEEKLKQTEDDRLQTIIQNRLATQEATKAITDKVKAEQTAEGSLVQMRQQLNELTKAYDQSSVRTKAAADEINNLSQKIQKAEEATNRHQRGVGGYKESIKDAAKEFLGFTGAVGIAVVVMDKLKEAFAETEQGVRFFKRLGEASTTFLQGLLSGNTQMAGVNALIAADIAKRQDDLRIEERGQKEKIASIDTEVKMLRLKAVTTKDLTEQLAIYKEADAKENESIALRREHLEKEIGLLTELSLIRPKDTKLLDELSQKKIEIVQLEGDKNLRIQTKIASDQQKIDQEKIANAKKADETEKKAFESKVAAVDLSGKIEIENINANHIAGATTDAQYKALLLAQEMSFIVRKQALYKSDSKDYADLELEKQNLTIKAIDDKKKLLEDTAKWEKQAEDEATDVMLKRIEEQAAFDIKTEKETAAAKKLIDDQANKTKAQDAKNIQKAEIDLAKETLNGLFNLNKQKLSAQLDDLEREKSAKLANTNLTAAQKASIEAEYAKKEAEIKTKQAQNDKKKALFDVAINTAVKISENLGNPLLITLIAIMGAVQEAFVLAQPLPKFAKGTSNAPYKGIFGEAGRELMFLRDGGMVMADKATYFEGNRFKGARIIPNQETERLIGASDRHIQGNSINGERLLKALGSVERAILNKPVMIFDKENRAIGQATSHSQTIYLNRLTRTNP